MDSEVYHRKAGPKSSELVEKTDFDSRFGSIS